MFNIIIFILFISANILASSSTKEAHWVQLPNVQSYISEQVKAHKFTRPELSLYLSQATIQPSIISKITHPYEAKPWPLYKQHFINQPRIKAGKKFYQQQQSTLNKVSNQYQVPANIITAIIGIESNYGKVQSHFKTLDALATLAFYYPARKKFFQSELSEYLTLVKRYHWHPLAIGSSYAGAMGMPQFMPSSYRRFAVSYTKQQPPNLFNNTQDVIASIANYLHHFKWQPQQPTLMHARMPKTLKNNNKWPITTNKHQLKKLGITVPKTIKPNTKILLWHFKGQAKNSLWVTFPNLKVIMHYNRSPMYAVATALLANKIAHEY